MLFYFQRHAANPGDHRALGERMTADTAQPSSASIHLLCWCLLKNPLWDCAACPRPQRLAVLRGMILFQRTQEALWWEIRRNFKKAITGFMDFRNDVRRRRA